MDIAVQKCADEVKQRHNKLHFSRRLLHLPYPLRILPCGVHCVRRQVAKSAP